MKFITALTFAASASAAAIEARQSPTRQISNFSAGCIPHSTFCEWSFEITSDPSLPPSHCSARIQSAYGELPTIGDGKCEDNAAYTWGAVDTQDGGYRFGIWFPLNSRSNITYCHRITPAQTTKTQDGAVITESYIGPTEFEASIEACN